LRPSPAKAVNSALKTELKPGITNAVGAYCSNERSPFNAMRLICTARSAWVAPATWLATTAWSAAARYTGALTAAATANVASRNATSAWAGRARTIDKTNAIMAPSSRRRRTGRRRRS
jgi:hypothetical protein